MFVYICGKYISKIENKIIFYMVQYTVRKNNFEQDKNVMIIKKKIQNNPKSKSYPLGSFFFFEEKTLNIFFFFLLGSFTTSSHTHLATFSSSSSRLVAFLKPFACKLIPKTQTSYETHIFLLPPWITTPLQVLSAPLKHLQGR